MEGGHRFSHHVHTPDKPTYKEKNIYGFVQTRILNEETLIEVYDPSAPMLQKEILNPKVCEIKGVFGEVTEFLAIDTEFD